MHHHLDMPELGEDEGAFPMRASEDVKAVLVLLEGEAIVARARSEAGIARLLPLLDAAEKAVKGPIHPLNDILQHLRVYLGQFRADLFALRQFSTLVRVARRDARQAVGIPAFLQGGVIGLAAERKPLVQRGKPRHGWFTNPGSDADRCPMHHDGGKIFLCSEQIIAVIGLFQ
jgi:hypothetical protein